MCSHSMTQFEPNCSAIPRPGRFGMPRRLSYVVDVFLNEDARQAAMISVGCALGAGPLVQGQSPRPRTIIRRAYEDS